MRLIEKQTDSSYLGGGGQRNLRGLKCRKTDMQCRKGCGGGKGCTHLPCHIYGRGGGVNYETHPSRFWENPGTQNCPNPQEVVRGGGCRHGVLFSSAAGGAYWLIAIRCPSLGPFPSIGDGAHRPLTTLCPSFSSLPYLSLSTSLAFPLYGCGNGAPRLSLFHCSVSGPHRGGQLSLQLARGGGEAHLPKQNTRHEQGVCPCEGAGEELTGFYVYIQPCSLGPLGAWVFSPAPLWAEWKPACPGTQPSDRACLARN